MKKSFQKSLIAASVGAVMFAAAGTASANSLLFPYFTTASGAQSALSLSTNTSANGAPGGAASGKEVLHYVYNYSASTGTPTAANTCIHFDANGSMSANDVLQHSIAAPSSGGYGKAVGSDTSTPVYLPLANQTGFLTVSTKSNAAARVSGDIAIADPATGLVVSYSGIDNGIADTTTATGNANEGDFSFIQDKTFDLSVYPTSLVTTNFYTLVVGNFNASIVQGRNWTGAATINNGNFVYDNDENPFSGRATKRVNCVATLTAPDFQTAAQAAALGASGGLIHATSVQEPVAAATTTNPAVTDVSTGLVVFKYQTVQAAVGAPFGGKQFAHRVAATGANTVVTSGTVVTTTTAP